jgi:hypothetical protein
VAPAQVQLLAATLDLQLVRLLRDAIRTADIGAAHTRALDGVGCNEPGVLHPADRFEPRDVIHPTPRFEPRPVLHPTPRTEVSPPHVPTEMEAVKVENRTLPPVWKTPVWKCEVAPEVLIKRIVLKPDVHRRGTLIDLFL